MFYRRIINLEDEDIPIAASMPPRDSDNESRDRRNNKHKAIEEVDSESDEENYRGLSRIALVSRRKRTKVAESVGADYHDKHIKDNEVISSEQNKSKSKHDIENPFTYYQSFDIDQDKDEYVEVDEVIYVIPPRSRPKLPVRRYQIHDTLGSLPIGCRNELPGFLANYASAGPRRSQLLRPRGPGMRSRSGCTT